MANPPLSNPLGFPPETVLTKAQLAAALNCSPDTIEKSGIPVSYALGPQMPRYVWRQVIAYIEKGAAA